MNENVIILNILTNFVESLLVALQPCVTAHSFFKVQYMTFIPTRWQQTNRYGNL